MRWRPRPLGLLLGAWALLAIPSVPLAGHQCYGFVGFLAHSPLYAFLVLTGVLAVAGLAAGTRRLSRALG